MSGTNSYTLIGQMSLAKKFPDIWMQHKIPIPKLWNFLLHTQKMYVHYKNSWIFHDVSRPGNHNFKIPWHFHFFHDHGNPYINVNVEIDVVFKVIFVRRSIFKAWPQFLWIKKKKKNLLNQNNSQAITFKNKSHQHVNAS